MFLVLVNKVVNERFGRGEKRKWMLVWTDHLGLQAACLGA